ncbi:MAG: hypothetical protein ACTSXJ_05015 [Candidatus Baldrarchaeia archaeon]
MSTDSSKANELPLLLEEVEKRFRTSPSLHHKHNIERVERIVRGMLGNDAVERFRRFVGEKRGKFVVNNI